MGPRAVELVLLPLTLALLADCRTENCYTPIGESGLCVILHECPALINRLRKGTNADIKYVQDSGCGFQGRIPLVCCVDPIPFSPSVGERFDLPPVDVSNHPNLHLLPLDECGEIVPHRVFNGEETGLYEFPWMAMLRYTIFGKELPRCGGTLINSKYVLTAAHCVEKVTDLTTVRLGEHDIRTDPDCENFVNFSVCVSSPQNFAIEEIIIHPKYRGSPMYYTEDKFQNDIALIRLRGEATYTETVRPICLPIGIQEQTRLLDNKHVVVAGWGTTEKGTSSPVLLKVDIPVVPLQKCVQQYVSQAPITSSQICAGGENKKDSCTGDSGGPLITRGEVQGVTKMVQHGIVSFGPSECAEDNKSGVYTRTGYFMEWILNNLKP